jgi:hypothetical protein
MSEHPVESPQFEEYPRITATEVHRLLEEAQGVDVTRCLETGRTRFDQCFGCLPRYTGIAVQIVGRSFEMARALFSPIAQVGRTPMQIPPKLPRQRLIRNFAQ